jgi:hypothetical protein
LWLGEPGGSDQGSKPPGKIRVGKIKVGEEVTKMLRRSW